VLALVSAYACRARARARLKSATRPYAGVLRGRCTSNPAEASGCLNFTLISLCDARVWFLVVVICLWKELPVDSIRGSLHAYALGSIRQFKGRQISAVRVQGFHFVVDV
jgi:hypothetical protein